MSVSARTVRDVTQDHEILFTGPGSLGRPRRSSCGKVIQGYGFGHRSDKGTLCLRRVRLSCGSFNCAHPFCQEKWAAATASRILEAAKGAILVHVQLALHDPDHVRSPEDLEEAWGDARGELKSSGATSGWVWIHATGSSLELASPLGNTVHQECPDGLHVHAVVVGSITDLRAGLERAWAFRLRRLQVVRGGELPDLLLHSSRPTNKSRVLRSFGGRGGRSRAARDTAEGSEAAPERPPSPPRRCPGCGEVAELGFFRAINGSGKPVEVPWDDDEWRQAADGASGIYWEAVDAREVVLQGGGEEP